MKEIHQMLDAYFAGTSTNEQDRDLRLYFAGSEVEPELEKYRAIFNCFDGMRSAGLSGFAAEPEQGRYAVEAKRGRYTVALKYFAAAAACIILAVIIVPSIRQSWRQTALCEGSFVIVDGKRYDSPEEISKHALSIINGIVATENQILQDIDFMPAECLEVFREHASILEGFKQ